MNTMEGPNLKRFVVRIFLWLPPCFAVWYFSGPLLASVAGGLARLMINTLTTGIVTAIERDGASLTFVTSLTVHPAPGQTALLLPEVNAFLYTYGLALFIALMLAERAAWWKIAAGAAAMLPFQSLGIASDVLAQVGLRLGPEVAAQAGVTGFRMEVVALVYQLGILIIPTLLPIMLWAVFSRLFLDVVFRSQAYRALVQ